MNLHPAVAYGDFQGVRRVAPEDEARGQADSVTLWEASPVTDSVGRPVQHLANPTRLVLRPAVVPVVELTVPAEKRETKLQRIPIGGGCNLVEEALYGEGAEGGLWTTPETPRQPTFDGEELGFVVVDATRRCGVRVETGDPGRCPAPCYLQIRGGTAVGPTDELPLVIQARANALHSGGTVEVVPHVVFTGPGELHGFLYPLCDQDRLCENVLLQATTEAASRAR